MECSLKKGVLKNFAKFTGKHLCKSLFEKGAGQRHFSKTFKFDWTFQFTHAKEIFFQFDLDLHDIKLY